MELEIELLQMECYVLLLGLKQSNLTTFFLISKLTMVSLLLGLQMWTRGGCCGQIQFQSNLTLAIWKQ
jgi:hypothetical protein